MRQTNTLFFFKPKTAYEISACLVGSGPTDRDGNFPGGPNAPKPLVTLAAGKIDIGYGGWLPFLDAVARGNDFVLIAATFSVSPLGILSLAGNPIKKASDIVGKKILAQGAKERLSSLPI